MKSNSNFSLDYNNYNNQIIKLKSHRYPRYNVIISSLLLLLILVLFFIYQTQFDNNLEVLSSTATENVKHEILHLPPIPSESINTLTFVEPLEPTSKVQQILVETIKQDITTKKQSPVTPTPTSAAIEIQNKVQTVDTPEIKNIVVEPTNNISYTIKSGDNLAWIFNLMEFDQKRFQILRGDNYRLGFVQDPTLENNLNLPSKVQT